MKKNFIKVLLLAAIAASQLAVAQTVVIDGEIRPRTEYRDGYGKPLLTTNDPGVFTIQRTRLGMTFTSGLLTTQITLQDSRTFGQAANASDVASTGIYEAWAEMLLVPGGSFKIGRQTLKYDDSRLFSSPPWSNTGTTHDVGVFKYNINDFQAHLGFAYNNNSAISSETYYTAMTKYRYMNFIWLSKDIIDGLNISAIGVDEGVQDTTGTKNTTTNYLKTRMYHAYTLGGNLKFQSDSCPVSAFATAYFQTGKNATGQTLNGKLLALKVDYKFVDFLSANIGTDYLSGDKNGVIVGTQSNFKKLYGSDHALNGVMDYWDTPLTQGLLDYYGGVTWKVGKKLTLEGAYHLFNGEYSGKNKKGIVFGKDLGSEFDFIATYKLNTWTTVQGGYCRYFSNNNTLAAKDITTSATVPAIRAPQWAYVMFTIKPKFL
ncbi:MAG TPA: alginate export family protein [Paludibacter sp.]|nr:alginate export family protein [Paludibacter sp.]